MAFNVAEFRSNLIGDGARPNLFQVTLTFPTIAENVLVLLPLVHPPLVQQLVQFLCIILVVN